MRAAAASYEPTRSGDLLVVPRPYWILSSDATTHGSANRYDQHVPLLLMGSGIRPGQYLTRASPADIAPTLALLAGVTLARPDGRVLAEALDAAGRPLTGRPLHARAGGPAPARPSRSIMTRSGRRPWGASRSRGAPAPRRGRPEGQASRMEGPCARGNASSSPSAPSGWRWARPAWAQSNPGLRIVRPATVSELRQWDARIDSMLRSGDLQVAARVRRSDGPGTPSRAGRAGTTRA